MNKLDFSFVYKKIKSDYKKTTEKKPAKDFQMFSLSHLIAFSFLCYPVVL